MEQEQKGQKRNGSPSLLVVCDQTNVKKQCALKIEDDAPVRDGSECSESKTSVKTQKMIDFSASKPTVSMRRCSGTPKAGLHAPGMLNTPRSVSRKSLISPGDEFWNEAFDVADGFYHPVDEASCARGERENVCPMDLSSCIAPSGGGIILRSENGVLETQRGEGEKCGMLLNGSDKSQAGVHRGKVSPLPVKHFDFSHDENIIKEKKFTLERSETLDALTSGAVDTSCINQNDVSTSSSKRNPETGIVGNAFDKAKGDSRKVHEILKGAFDAIEEVNLLVQENDAKSKGKGLDAHVGESYVVRGSFSVEERKIRSIACKTNDATATPLSSMPLKNHLQLTSWLPSEICSIYMKKGISSLYPWQVLCISICINLLLWPTFPSWC